ncbi:uncharacterized protein LOC125192179 [Salvia hispanica]|uniref:uncharacterized protein LOC125192179 n=1 Tax=Salvia hispanica TaxID=49212 RepID=UPI0020090A52|nr:uncharacterized protein LOC125192179 [Salvia hispanica]
MVPLDALAAFLSQQDPNRDWTTILAGFGLTGGVPATSNPTPTTTTENPPTTTPKTSIPTSENISPTIAAQAEPSHPSLIHQTEPLDVSPLSAYQDHNWGETEGKESGGGASASEKGEEEEIRATEVKIDAAEEEIDLNETVRKQGIMTDDVFQAVLGKGDRIVVNPAGVAEVMDLASQVVGKEEAATEAEKSEGIVHQSVEERTDEQRETTEKLEEERQEAEKHQEEASVVTKPKPVKRKLVLKSDPKAEWQKPQRVSQRCLGRWTSTKAGANTAANTMEVSSDDEKTTPTKPGEEPSNASQVDTQLAKGTVSSTPTDQEEKTDKVAEGLDLASASVGQEEEARSDTSARMVTEPTAQEDISTQADDEAETMEIEVTTCSQERKRKGKAPVKMKQVMKKQRTANAGIVIREPEERGKSSDSDYTSSEESESESDISLEREEYREQQLPNDHHKLVHPPIERLVYRRWRVELTDELIEDMKRFDTKKLQDAFDDKDDSSKQVKCGKVLHIPSLDELSVRDSFLASIEALGFEWLLENRDPEISVRLAKEFFTTFRFQVTTDLDEVSISFRIFGGKLSMSLIGYV